MHNEYRAWIDDIKKICDVFYLNYDTEEAGICIEGACITVPLGKIILMKNTGKQDISGRNVYEGDIIESHQNGLILDIVMIIKYGTYDAYCPADDCYMDNVGFYVEAVGYPQMPLGPVENYARVVGNIFENPDLLEISGGGNDMNKKEFVEVDEKKCEEVNNCTGVKIVDGKKYCRGCGKVQPEGVPIGYADQSGLAPVI